MTAYYTIEKWLNEEMNNTDGFSWVNCSATIDSGTNTDDDNMLLINEIKNQIERSSIFIIISDIYKDNKKLMDFEIETAKQFGKYIIGLKTWRGLKPVPKMILKNADEIVNLRKSDLINSINKYNEISGSGQRK
ncbi:MAG: hypothetical protein ACYCWE_13785 [Eubacteriales bacterium]